MVSPVREDVDDGTNGLLAPTQVLALPVARSKVSDHAVSLNEYHKQV